MMLEIRPHKLSKVKIWIGSHNLTHNKKLLKLGSFLFYLFRATPKIYILVTQKKSNPNIIFFDSNQFISIRFYSIS